MEEMNIRIFNSRADRNSTGCSYARKTYIITKT